MMMTRTCLKRKFTRQIVSAVRCMGMLGFIVSSVGPAHAQTTTSTVLGTVQDTSGAVLPGATITITNSNTGFSRTVVSGSDGTYLIPAVPAGGPYQMTFALDGFKTRAQEGVRTE